MGMRQGDEQPPPEALRRQRRESIRFYAGLGIAVVGLATVAVGLIDRDITWVTLGFSVAFVGAGIVPFERIVEAFRR